LKLHRKIQKKQRKISNKRTDYLHKTSKHIVDYCFHNQIDNIICGDIQTKKLKTDKEQMKKLSFKDRRSAHSRNKSTQNEGLLSRFKGFIQYKAENRGIKFILVNEAYTSQKNCLTSERNLSSALDVREVELEKGFMVDRDLNSAVNIAKKYGALWTVHPFSKYSLLNVKEMSFNELE